MNSPLPSIKVVIADCHTHELLKPRGGVAAGNISTLQSAGLQAQVKNYSGIYNPRPIRGQTVHPSTHSWGIAIDLEAEKYPLGSKERFPDPVVKIFSDAGFFYGGDFASRKDPMHFQFCKEY